MSEQMSEGFITLSEWGDENGSEKFRLIKRSAGPDVLQVFSNGEWRDESQCYIHGVLCHRIAELESYSGFEKLKKSLKDDPDYVHSWYCNLTMSFLDEMSGDFKTDREIARGGASRFMKICFDIDIKDELESERL